MIEFKFHGERAFRELAFKSHRLTAEILKAAICEKLQLSIEMDLDLENEKGECIPADKTWTENEKISLICRRIPRARDPNITTASIAAAAANDDVHRALEDAATDRLCERQELNTILAEEPIKAGPVLRYSKSYRHAVQQQEWLEKREMNSSSSDAVAETERPLPHGYVCNRCGLGDHWYWNCPTIDDPDHVRKVRTAKGIPRWYLTKVKDVEEAQSLSLGGVTLVIPGNLSHYVWTHNPDKQEHRDRVGDTIQEKVVTAFSDGAKQVEGSLKCPLCHRLFRSAVLAPCCGATFCSECAIERLCHNGISNSCPNCKKELLAHQLVPNQDIRNQIQAVLRASTGKKQIEDKLNIDTIQIASRKRKHDKMEMAIAPSRTCLAAAPEYAALPSHTRSKLVLSLRSKLRAVPRHSICIQADAPLPSVVSPPQSSQAVPAQSSQAVPAQSSQAPVSLDIKDEWLDIMDDFISFPPTPKDETPKDTRKRTSKDKTPKDTRKRTCKEDKTPKDTRKRIAQNTEKSRTKPMSKKEFKKCQQAWSIYHEKLARKEQRRANREDRERERAKKNR